VSKANFRQVSAAVQPESWYSFYHLTDGKRLTRSRHCNKGVQPMQRLYIAVFFFVINTQTRHGWIRTGKLTHHS